MQGIEKVIEELGLIIISKDAELDKKQLEIDALRRKVELIEQYLDTYDKFYNGDCEKLNK